MAPSCLPQHVSMNPRCRRKGKDKPVIRKALVDMEGPVFREFAKRRAAWAAEDAYRLKLQRTCKSSKVWGVTVTQNDSVPGVRPAAGGLGGRGRLQGGVLAVDLNSDNVLSR